MKHRKIHEVMKVFMTPKSQGNNELINNKYVNLKEEAFGPRSTTVSSAISSMYSRGISLGAEGGGGV